MYNLVNIIAIIAYASLLWSPYFTIYIDVSATQIFPDICVEFPPCDSGLILPLKILILEIFAETSS